MFEGISFQTFRADHENSFLAYSRLYLGIWIFFNILYCIWSSRILGGVCSIDFLDRAGSRFYKP